VIAEAVSNAVAAGRASYAVVVVHSDDHIAIRELCPAAS
jgi:hypothetical protein